MFDLAGLFAVDPRAEEAVLIEQIAGLERLKSAAAAGQARAAAALDAWRRADEAAAGCRRGSARVGWPVRWRWRGGIHRCAAVGIWGSPKALVHEMPHTLAALECGALSEWRATMIVRVGLSGCAGSAGVGRRNVRRCRQIGWDG